MFQLKSVSGVARQSQIMAALEEVSAQMDRNAKSKKDPLARLASQYSPDADVALVIQGLSVDATRLNGTKITLLAPVITYAAQHVPDPVLTRALPDVQKYVFDQMSTRFKPVRASELRDTKN
jgi:fructose-specific component phosphotransferase system IIB-like protein